MTKCDTKDRAVRPVNENQDSLKNQELSPGVYLFPVTMTDGEVTDVLPPRNVELMKQVKFFVVENVRTARRFLRKIDRSFDIDSVIFTELSEHTDPSEVDAMLEPVRQGHAVGVMSEAGCPAVADPGALLVEAAQRASLKVIPLVGPSSIILALMGSGMNGQNFAFHGYLPVADGPKSSALRAMASEINHNGSTQIFIETPYRNNRLIESLIKALPGNLKLCVASDITGEKESIVTKTLSEWKRSKFDYNKIPTIFVLGR